MRTVLDILLYLRTALTMIAIYYLSIILFYCLKRFRNPWAWILLDLYAVIQVGTRFLIMFFPGTGSAIYVFESALICFNYSIMDLVILLGVFIFALACRELHIIFFKYKN